MPVSILIVDDHPVICHGLTRILEKQGDMVIIGEAGDWKSALEAVKLHQPDVVILDITLQGIDGVSLINRMKENGVKTRIIMYTMHNSRDYITRAFQAGALGYILKSDKMEQLVTAIREVMNGKVYLSNSLSETIMTDLLGGRNIAEISGTSSLTPREYEVASLVSQGLSIEQIGETLFISPQTVRVHRTRIMHKLSCSGVHELLLKLREYFPQ
ncbi:response regulator [Desulfopila aestuarii]|uniref:Two component transcriptional regulator, LuxR family n=1 Tax=Desulfopila aestuarii DSM 18488 TaxID=1121416 RepID=A0A1M7Y8W4_9BACT|nr:response regulator transcription factor [Desulfopila aestuarii]SHO48968.1 two component transcriptional regulator, LuxR family [Desulfopila aestuarii DSM 18488]